MIVLCLASSLRRLILRISVQAFVEKTLGKNIWMAIVKREAENQFDCHHHPLEDSKNKMTVLKIVIVPLVQFLGTRSQI
jgi:hypothetical protein